MRFIILIYSLLGLAFTANAKSLQFSELEWDFGTIAEDGGDVSHTFSIKNEGAKPIVIYNVSTSCGCTTPNYSRKPIARGESTPLEIVFDPYYRPGRFSKSIYVYSSATEEPTILKIVGDVTPRVLPIEERYPYTLCGEMRIGSLFVSFRAVPHGRLVQQSVEFRNMATRERSIEFRSRESGTPLQLHFDNRVGANKGSTLEVGYYIERGRGNLVDTVDIYVDGRKIDKYISIKGLIVE